MKKLLFFVFVLCTLLFQGCASSNSRDHTYYPAIGMTKEEVLRSAWNSPRQMNKTATASGTSEVWIYAGPSYLFFDESGILQVINSPHLESKPSAPTQEELNRRYQEFIRKDDARRAREGLK